MRLFTPAYWIICILLVLVKRAPTDEAAASGVGNDDLVGVRIDTAAAIKDFNSGLIVIKGETDVSVRLFGTRLQDTKNVRVTKSGDSCGTDNAVDTVSSESFTEISPLTAAFKFKFPDYSTTYYFCIEWRRPAALMRAPPSGSWGHRSNDTTDTTSITTDTDGRVTRDANEAFAHQGSARYLSVSTAAKSWFG